MHMISPKNYATIAARRLTMSVVILCTLLLRFSIDTRAPQEAVGLLSAAAQTHTTQEKTVTIPIEGMV
jgi:hypothetical protein